MVKAIPQPEEPCTFLLCSVPSFRIRTILEMIKAYSLFQAEKQFFGDPTILREIIHSSHPHYNILCNNAEGVQYGM